MVRVAFFIVMLSVVMLSVVKLSVAVLSVVVISVQTQFTASYSLRVRQCLLHQCVPQPRDYNTKLECKVCHRETLQLITQERHSINIKFYGLSGHRQTFYKSLKYFYKGTVDVIVIFEATGLWHSKAALTLAKLAAKMSEICRHVWICIKAHLHVRLKRPILH